MHYEHPQVGDGHVEEGDHRQDLILAATLVQIVCLAIVHRETEWCECWHPCTVEVPFCCLCLAAVSLAALASACALTQICFAIISFCISCKIKYVSTAWNSSLTSPCHSESAVCCTGSDVDASKQERLHCGLAQASLASSWERYKP